MNSKEVISIIRKKVYKILQTKHFVRLRNQSIGSDSYIKYKYKIHFQNKVNYYMG